MPTPNPVTTEWVPLWDTSGAVGGGGGGGPHHATHEPGGIDALVNVAWTDQTNTFLYHQTFKNGFTIENATPYWYLFNPAGPVDSKRWLLQALSGDLFRIGALNDAANVWMGTVDISRAGGISASGGLTVAGTSYLSTTVFSNYLYPWNAGLGVAQSTYYLGYHSGYPGPGAVLTNASLACGGHLYASNWIYPGSLNTSSWQQDYYLAAHSSYGLYSNTGLYLAGNLWVVGATTLSGDLYVSHAVLGGSLEQKLGYYVYPGSASGLGNYQTSYYLASHDSWGLYTNTSMYFAGGVYTPYLYLTGYSTSWYWGVWPSGFYTNVSIKTAGNLYVSNQESNYLAADGAGMFVNTTFQARAGHLFSGYWIFPGAITNPGVIQNGWYLASHSTYGLYTNTGLYAEGAIYSGAALYAPSATIATGNITTANITTCNVSSVLSTVYMRSMGLVARGAETGYYAYQDGIVVVTGYWAAGGHIYIMSDTSGGYSNMKAQMGSDANVPGFVEGTIVAPIPYGYYYKATRSGNSVVTSMTWYPIGSYTG